MYEYINTKTQEYPLHEGDIRLLFPEISEDLTGDAFPCPEGFAVVVWVEPPEIDQTKQKYYFGTPEIVNGQWATTWLVRNLTQRELNKIQALSITKDET